MSVFCCDTMDYSFPGPSIHGISQARILEWLPFPPPGDLPNPEIEPPSVRQILYHCPPGKPKEFCCSVAKSCPTLGDPMDCMQHARLPCPSPTPRACSGSCPLSRWSIQPSHPLLSPSPPSFNQSQHQGLFKWVGSLHQVAKVLEFQLQQHSFRRTPRTLEWTVWISLQSKGL